MDLGNGAPTLLEETRTSDGFVMGTYGDPLAEENLREGFGYVLLPNGSRLDITWEWYKPYRAVFTDDSGVELALPPVEEPSDRDEEESDWESQEQKEKFEAFDRDAFAKDHPFVGHLRYEIPTPLKTPRDVYVMFCKMLPLYRNIYDQIQENEGKPVCVGHLFRHFYGCGLVDALKENLTCRRDLVQKKKNCPFTRSNKICD